MSRKNKLIIFIKADYPDIDPNIIHKIDDLHQEGYTVERIFPTKREKRNDAKIRYGIAVNVEITEYDYDRIMKEFHYDKPMWFVKEANGWCVFSDGEKYINICKSKLDNYFITHPVLCRVYCAETVECVMDNWKLTPYILESFQIERKIVVEYDDVLLLSVKQVDTVDAMLETPILKSIYDEENPNIFVKIHRQEES